MKEIKHEDYNLEIDELKKFIKFNSGNSGLTNHFIYRNLPKNSKNSVIVFSPSKEKDKVMGYVDEEAQIKNKNIKVYNGETILLVRKGSAGTMHYFNNCKYTINEDAYVLEVRKEYKDKINLQWFSFHFQKLFYNLSTSRGGNGTFSKTYAEKQVIEIPDLEIQEKELATFVKLESHIKSLTLVDNSIDTLLRKIISLEKEEVQEYIIKDIFYLDTGKRVLQRELYENIDIDEDNDENIIPIFSSGIELEGLFGYASKIWLESDRFLRKEKANNSWEVWKNEIGESFIIDEPCITWNTDGNAGSLFYRDYKFFPTDHCGVLIPKEEYKGKINLEFFKYSQQYSFKQTTERGNLHKEKMATQTFELPNKDIQDDICDKLNKLTNIQTEINKLKKSIYELMAKNIL